MKLQNFDGKIFTNLRKPMNKKGEGIFSGLGGMAISIATVAIVLIISFLIMAKTKDQIEITDGVAEYSDANGSMAWNATREMQNNTTSIVGWVGLVVIVAIGVLILGLVRQIR